MNPTISVHCNRYAALSGGLELADIYVWCLDRKWNWSVYGWGTKQCVSHLVAWLWKVTSTPGKVGNLSGVECMHMTHSILFTPHWVCYCPPGNGQVIKFD